MTTDSLDFDFWPDFIAKAVNNDWFAFEPLP
jgi:hypothetical protein